ncbi:hypothetical protein FIU28_17035 [Tardiphaga sp. vice154]|uniref:hypothetical protein n=1 Tax=Tardiphaga sp. vice154 TaxID=2592814 RepID=UPI0011628C43|nr:hypothetical protein [Tardiphaga sp. vice154]QDM22665.1 hypothetical protein FIU28_17035 [Tardiphaga sp. vice154]
MMTSLQLEAAICDGDVEALLADARSGACALWSSSSFSHAPAISEWTTEVFTDGGGQRWVAIRGLVCGGGGKKASAAEPRRTTGVRWIDCRRRWCITADRFYRLGKSPSNYKDTSDG